MGRRRRQRGTNRPLQIKKAATRKRRVKRRRRRTARTTSTRREKTKPKRTGKPREVIEDIQTEETGTGQQDNDSYDDATLPYYFRNNICLKADNNSESGVRSITDSQCVIQRG